LAQLAVCKYGQGGLAMLHLAESLSDFWRPVLPQINADIRVEQIASAH